MALTNGDNINLIVKNLSVALTIGDNINFIVKIFNLCVENTLEIGNRHKGCNMEEEDRE